MSRVFSPLAKGCGTWSGELFDDFEERSRSTKKSSALPFLTETDHKHGFTVTPRMRTALINTPTGERQDGQLIIPKTFVTRKGAMVLFTAPENAISEMQENDKRRLKRKLLRGRHTDIETKFGTLARFARSVLSFGDENYPPENTSISDPPDTAFLQFIRTLSDEGSQGNHGARPKSVKPGSDLQDYLRDLCASSPSLRTAHSRATTAVSTASRIARELHDEDIEKETLQQRSGTPHRLSADTEQLLHRHQDRVNSAGSRSSQRQVLSSQKLVASVKSASYLGRPYTAPQPSTDSLLEDFFYDPEGRPPTPNSSTTSSLSLSRSNKGKVSSASRNFSRRNSSRFGRRQPNGHTWSPDHSSFVSVGPADDNDEGGTYNSGMEDEGAENVAYSSRCSSVSGYQVVQRENEGDVEDGTGPPQLFDDTFGDQEEEKLDLMSQKSLLTSSSFGPELNEILDNQMTDENKTHHDHQPNVECTNSILGSARSLHDVPSLPNTATDVDVPTHSHDPYAPSVSQLANVSQSHVSPAPGLSQLVDHSTDGARTTHSRTDSFIKPKSEFSFSEKNNNSSPTSATVKRRHPTHDEEYVQSSVGSESKTPTQNNLPDVQHDLSAMESVPVVPSPSSRYSDARRSKPVTPEPQLSQQTSTIHTWSRQSSQQSLSRKNIEEDEVSKIDGSIQPLQPQYEAAPELFQTKMFVSRKSLASERPVDDRKREEEEEEPARYTITKHVEESEHGEESGTNNLEPITAMEVLKKIEKQRPVDGSSVEENFPDTDRNSTETESKMGINIGKSTSQAPSHSGFQSPTQDPSHLDERDLGTKGTPPVDGTSGQDDNSTVVPSVGSTVERVVENTPAAASLGNTAPSEIKAAATLDKRDTPSKVLPHSKVPTPPKSGTTTKQSKERFRRSQKNEPPSEKKQSKGKEEKKTDDKTLKSKVESSEPKKQFVQALDISSRHPMEDDEPAPRLSANAKNEIEKLLAGGKPKTPDRAKRIKVVTPKLEPVVTKTKEEEDLEKLEKEMNQMFRRPSPPDGGLSLEEMEIEQQILKEKMAAAETKLNEAGQEKEVKPKRKALSAKVKKEKVKEPKRDLLSEKQALREQRRLEKQKRLEEAKKLQSRIREKDLERQVKKAEADKRKAVLEEELNRMAEEAEFFKQQEEEARDALAAARAAAREERELKRKADIERKKQEAVERREREKKAIEAGKQREHEMLMNIASAEEKRQLAEEERLRREEAEEQEELLREQEEERLLREAAFEEERIQEAEREAEEEAMARLISEREEAEQLQWQLEEQQRRIHAEQEAERLRLEEETRQLEELKLKQEEEERRRYERERMRLLELQKLEDEAREQMKLEMERRREAALRRREQNLERRSNLESVRQTQGLTRPWVFSYFVLWPRETYERPMGPVENKKKGFRPRTSTAKSEKS